jgi:hypothetical protein
MVEEYTKYNQDTGEIEYTFTGNPEDAAVNQPCIKGNYSFKEYVILNGKPVKKSDEEINEIREREALVLLRDERNARLIGSDWTQLPDVSVDKEAWALYRQQLRDMTDNIVDPFNPVWPKEPQ